MNSRAHELPRDAARTRTVLYLGRLHPLKGLDLLVEAWARVKVRSSLVHYCVSALVGRPEGGGQRTEDGGQKTEDGKEDSAFSLQPSSFPSWNLVIAGPDEQGTLKALKEQVKRLELEYSVTFSGPLYGEEKTKILQCADLFVLPTRSDNFGIAVAEALAAGVPVITTHGAPWSELLGHEGSNAADAAGSIGLAASFNRLGGLVQGDANENNDSSFILHPSSLADNGRCGWWVDIGAEPLAAALREAMGLSDEERRAMGKNGRRLVERKYRWETVAAKMVEVYSACLRG